MTSDNLLFSVISFRCPLFPLPFPCCLSFLLLSWWLLFLPVMYYHRSLLTGTAHPSLLQSIPPRIRTLYKRTENAGLCVLFHISYTLLTWRLTPQLPTTALLTHRFQIKKGGSSGVFRVRYLKHASVMTISTVPSQLEDHCGSLSLLVNKLKTSPWHSPDLLCAISFQSKGSEFFVEYPDRTTLWTWIWEKMDV